MSRYTQWFPRDIKPVRIGLYKRRLPSSNVVYSMWDGKRWLVGADTKKLAATSSSFSGFQSLQWQGLRKKS